MRLSCKTLVRRAILLLACLVMRPADVAAADQWIEVKSAHFTVASNAGDRRTRTLVWQLEQIRSATAALWGWARLDLNKPLSIVIVKDESGMRALAPQYWETRRAIHPATVWVTGPDRHYLVLRADVEVEDRGTINPYLASYASYISLVLRQSVSRPLPAWFEHGFTGVLSNTIVRESDILLGAPIPWHLQTLRQRPALTLVKLLAVSRQSPDVTEADRREVFDAETWALVHFLMFGEEGRYAAKLNAYSKSVSTGKEPAAAFAEAFGPVEALEGPFRRYIDQPIFRYQKVNLDVSVEREKFPSRPMAVAEAASARALLLASMQRPVESRAAIAEARKADASAAGSYVAEGLLFDLEQKPAEAKAAFTRAAELGSTNGYGYYRLATLKWQPSPSRDTYAEIEQDLSKAVSLNTRDAAAYAWLGEVQTFLGKGDGLGMVRRAISLEPAEARHRMRAVNVLLRQGKPDEARVEAEAAVSLADSEDERRDASRLLELVEKVRAAASPPKRQ
jgi:tetratricopeptide (TPR) repeat protein